MDKPLIIGLTRVRNESKIIHDTLDHLSEFCTGGIFVYDDCSTDDTAQICENHPYVKYVIKGLSWDNNREKAEFENRQALLAKAKNFAKDIDWFVYVDADERIEFNWNLIETFDQDVVAVRMKLFDFYITPEDINRLYIERKWLGPEFREIIMAFKNSNQLRYEYADQREVTLGDGKIISSGFVKHFGKAISVDEWEKTCEYYSSHFPKYSKKWEQRKGKAVHNGVSDFQNKLITWDEKEEKGFSLTALESNYGHLKILLTNHHLLDYRGSEVYTLTLADHLKQNGCDVIVYSRYFDKMEKEFKKLGIPIFNNIYEIKNHKLDVAHVHHNINAAEVRYHFPELPIVFQSHGVIPFLEQPPLLELGISKYLAVSEEVHENLLQCGVDTNNITIFRNLIDESKFLSAKKINPAPETALVSSGRLDEQKENIIRQACKELNINLKFIGGRFGQSTQTDLKLLVEEADIIFTLGRGAVEAMFMGRIPLIYDYQGGDGLVTVDSFEEIMKCNFSGRRYQFEYNVKDLINEILKYDSTQAIYLREKALHYYSANKISKDLIELYKTIVCTKPPDRNDKSKTELNYFVKSIEETRDYSFESAFRDFKKIDTQSTKNNGNEDIMNKFDSTGDEEVIETLLEIDKLIMDKKYNVAKSIIEEKGDIKYNNSFLSRAAKIEILSGNLLFAEIILSCLEQGNGNSKYITGIFALLKSAKENLRASTKWETETLSQKLIEAESNIEKNNLDDAENQLLEVLNVETLHYDALNNLAVVYILRENYEKAVNIILFLLRNNPENEIALGNLQYLQELGKFGNKFEKKEQPAVEAIKEEFVSNGHDNCQLGSFPINESNFPTQSEKKINIAASLLRQADNSFYSNNLNSAEILLRKALTFIKDNPEFDQPQITGIQNVNPNQIFSYNIQPILNIYEEWLLINDLTADDFNNITTDCKRLEYRPLISVIIPVYNIDPKLLFSCVNSVLSQIYSNWELCLVDDGSTKEATIHALKKIEKLDSRIKVHCKKTNNGISSVSNIALSISKGEFIALLDNDDELTIDALYEIAKLLNQHKEADFIYSDEDKLDANGKRCEPFFKPDWSPELLRSYSYTCHLSVFRKSLVLAVGGFDDRFNGAQDYDLTLRTIEKTNNIFHVPKILYHWRKIPGSAAEVVNAKGWALIAAKKALEEHLLRCQLDAQVLNSEFVPGCFRVRYNIKENPLVSILLPTRGQINGNKNDELLFKCIQSIVSKTEYSNYEIIVGYNNKLDSEIENFLKSFPHRAVNYKLNGKFNFANKINFMAKQAKGEHLIIFNDDLEVISSEWLSALLEFSQQKEIGVVGSKLLFPNGRLQHVGMVLGINGYPAHIFHNAKQDYPGYRGDANLIRNYSAVTGAGMMVKKNLFNKLHGLDESFRTDYNDTDFCMRVMEKGYRNVYTPYSLFYHHESAVLSSGRLNQKETELFQKRWNKCLKNDPYYNPNLTKKNPDYSLDICQV